MRRSHSHDDISTTDFYSSVRYDTATGKAKLVRPSWRLRGLWLDSHISTRFLLVSHVSAMPLLANHVTTRLLLDTHVSTLALYRTTLTMPNGLLSEDYSLIIKGTNHLIAINFTIISSFLRSFKTMWTITDLRSSRKRSLLKGVLAFETVASKLF